MRIGHYQCVCRPADYARNLEAVRSGLNQATERGVELLCFPEAFLGGYFASEEQCRQNAWPLDGPETRRLLAATKEFPVMFMVGFNELRGTDLYDTVVLVEHGAVIGTYSKAFPVMPYFRSGREAPVFEKGGCKFGIIICADGGYPEPARIMAMKGARTIFAPHYNYIGADTVVDHYVHVRHDHIARAVENGVFFVRGNNVAGDLEGSLGYGGVGYGDSYILDPNGQIIAAANLHAEVLIWADIDLGRTYYGGHNKAARSAKAFWEQIRDAALADEA